MDDRAEPVRDDDSRGAHLVHALGHGRLGPVVERARGLVEKHDPWLVDDRSRDHQALLLAAREAAPTLADVSVHAHRHRGDVVREARHGSGLPGFFDRARRGADDVSVDVGGEDAIVLQDDSELLPHETDVQRRKVLSVVEDRPLLGLLEAEHETHHRGLSGSGSPDERDELARFDLQRDVLQDERPIFRVPEVNVRDLDVALEDARRGLRVVDLRQSHQDGREALPDRDGLQQVQGGIAESLHGSQEEPE